MRAKPEQVSNNPWTIRPPWLHDHRWPLFQNQALTSIEEHTPLPTKTGKKTGQVSWFEERGFAWCQRRQLLVMGAMWSAIRTGLQSLLPYLWWKEEQNFIDACKAGDMGRAKRHAAWKRLHYSTFDAAFHAACKAGQLDVAKWLHGISGGSYHWWGHVVFPLFQDACTHGRLEMAKWLYGCFASKICGRQGFLYENRIFDRICWHGHLELAKWLHGLGLVDMGGLGPFEAFVNACYKGHVEMVQWLVADVIGHRHCDHDRAFQLACQQGQTQTAQWLLWNVRGINPHVNAEGALRAACHYGRLPTVKWLLPIIAHGANRDHVRQAYRAAWFHGNLETAKWLSGQGLDVDSDMVVQDFDVVGLCTCDHLETARWLIGREPDRVWPDQVLSHVRKWSPERDAWIQAVVCSQLVRNG